MPAMRTDQVILQRTFEADGPIAPIVALVALDHDLDEAMLAGSANGSESSRRKTLIQNRAKERKHVRTAMTGRTMRLRPPFRPTSLAKVEELTRRMRPSSSKRSFD